MRRTSIHWLGLLLLVWCAAACGGSDSKPNGTACPDGTMAGAQLPCSCGDAGMVGKQTCQMNGTLGSCDCSGAGTTSGGTGGMGTTGGTGGMGTTGGAGGMGMSGGTGGMGTSGGTGGMVGGATDGGTTAPSDGGSSGPVQPLPSDGNQLAVCASAVDCNKDYACFNTTGPSQGFCTKTCQSDDDCMGLSGGTYSCQTAQGVCVIHCMGTDDTSCPDQMDCEQTGRTAGGGTGGATDGGTTTAYTCTYPESAGITPMPAWSMCTSATSADCETDLTCTGMLASPSRTGFCAQSCMTDGDCTTKPSSGAIDPTCVSVGGFGGGGMQQMRCELDCTTNTDGCPDGMSCVMMGGGGGGMAVSHCQFD